MPTDWVSAFINGLHALEDRGEIEPLLAQFAPNGSLWNITHREPLRGEAEVRHFWEGYRRTFAQIHSEFERIIEADGQAALEWSAEGTLNPGEAPIAYRGVTLLRRGEGGISEFASYYDPAPFQAQPEPHSQPAAAAAAPEELDDERIEEQAPSVMSYG